MRHSPGEGLPGFASVMREFRERRLAPDGRVLNQAQASDLTGLSSYRLFEAGNRVPSAFALAQIVRGLKLDDQERHSLYTTAGIPAWSASCGEGIAGAQELAPAVHQLVHPSYVSAPWGQVVVANMAACEWLSTRFTDKTLPCAQRNSWVHLFSDEGLRRWRTRPAAREGWQGVDVAWPGRQAKKSELLDRYMAEIKAVYLRHEGHRYCCRPFAELIYLLKELSPRFRRRWDVITCRERDRAVTWWTIYPRWNETPQHPLYDEDRELVYRLPCLVASPWALQFSDFRLVQIFTDKPVQQGPSAWRWRRTDHSESPARHAETR